MSACRILNCTIFIAAHRIRFKCCKLTKTNWNSSMRSSNGATARYDDGLFFVFGAPWRIEFCHNFYKFYIILTLLRLSMSVITARVDRLTAKSVSSGGKGEAKALHRIFNQQLCVAFSSSVTFWFIPNALMWILFQLILQFSFEMQSKEKNLTLFLFGRQYFFSLFVSSGNFQRQTY